jgi:exosortase
MASTEQNLPPRAVTLADRGIAFWTQLAILAVLISLLYFHILQAWIEQWLTDPNYSHGFFVPLFSIWILWKDRRRLAEVERKPSWAGLLIVVCALAILLLGVLGAEFFLSRTSLLFLLAGLLVQFKGWRFFRAVLFPWAILFLAVPIPVIVFNRLSFPLQFFASRLASALLAIFGVPVLREGNVIHLPSLTLDVAEACSGLRSLVSLIALAVFLGYLFEDSNVRRAILVLAAIPVAVFANGLRIMGSGLLGEYWSPDKAEGFFHFFSGWLIFVLASCCLLLILFLIRRLSSPWIARQA